MRTAIAFLALLVLASLAFTQQQLNYLNYLDSHHSGLTADQLINQFVELQPELFKKVFVHYISQQIGNWRQKGWSKFEVKEGVLALVNDPNGSLLASLSNYMQERLFRKLEMGQLTDSLQAEIKNHPDNFYLTFDIYDLLFD